MISRKTVERLNLIIASLCLIILGVLIGKYQERISINAKSQKVEFLQKDINEGVPAIKILGIKDGELVGEITAKEVRVMTETEVATVDENLNFVLPFNSVLRKNLLFDVPPEMNYLASRQGKNFYNIYSGSAKKIAPQNRIFFRTKAEALFAGYFEGE